MYKFKIPINRHNKNRLSNDLLKTDFSFVYYLKTANLLKYRNKIKIIE